MSLRVRRTDLRTETTFLTGIAPANGSTWKTIYLVFRNQIAYPFLQGLLWALAKDWYAVGAAFTRAHGHAVGKNFRVWVSTLWPTLGGVPRADEL